MRFRRKAVKVRRGPGAGARLRGVLAVASRPTLTLLVPAAALAAACALGLHIAQRHVAASHEYRIAAPRIALPSTAPPWWEKEFEDQINAACAFANGKSVFEAGVLEAVAEGYLRCPWVKRVLWVEKRFPNRISASVELRMPAAAVVQPSGQGYAFYLLGDDGVRLPKVYTQWPRPGLQVPCVTGVACAPPEPGHVWPEKSVLHAVHIARLLQSSEVVRRALNVTAVDVANYGGRADCGRSEFVVLTANRCVIEWGRSPDTEQVGELPVSEKIAKLERFLIDNNPTANRTLDLRFPGRVVVSRRSGTDGDRG